MSSEMRDCSGDHKGFVASRRGRDRVDLVSGDGRGHRCSHPGRERDRERVGNADIADTLAAVAAFVANTTTASSRSCICCAVGAVGDVIAVPTNAGSAIACTAVTA